VTSRLAGAGMKVAVIERHAFGGTCVNTGCIPTKTMVASAYAARIAARAAEYGVEVGSVRVDMKRVMARKDAVSKASRTGLEDWLRNIEMQPLIDYINGVTGWNMSLFELMKVGERNNTLARVVFNCREGFTPADDVIPQHLHEGIGNGALKGSRVDPDEFLAARRIYYEMAGWDPETGRPTAAKLAELDVV
jgi:aldehyde:ferredoxin oxidoreductase